MARNKPVTDAIFDLELAGSEGILGALHDLARAIESAGVESAQPLRRIVHLTALSAAAADLAKAIAGRLAMDEMRREAERMVRREAGGAGVNMGPPL